ncbi:MAG TPA: beta-ketoacyl synthase chain length factor [Fulvivirga sp.]|nr:beta-ketoacyl synthase chain length factor [Fulvivirga sp.]
MFIKDLSCISAQETYHNSVFTDGVKDIEDLKIWAQEPDYKDIIPAGMLRRMSKLVRMSVATAGPFMEEHKNLGGVIFGSSNGSVDRSMRFLRQIIQYEEGTLTPTDFVQSTPNCVAGVLALMGNITGYNTTHVNQGLSFESSILDALLLFEEGKVSQLLLGGGDELSEANYNIESQRDLYKEESIATSTLLRSETKGTLPGEGVAMFVVEAEKTKESLAEIIDVDMIHHASKQEVAEKAVQFLNKNGLKPSDIDAVIMGRNGDVRTDNFYDHLQNELFPEQGIIVYKSLTGDYYSVSAVATWLATKVLSGTQLPSECIWKPLNNQPKTILLYNNCEGKQHGFVLMRGVYSSTSSE